MTIQLPSVYRDFINANGLFEGFAVAAGEEHYVVLWGDDEVASANAEIEIPVYAPGFVAFAGNGGGEVFAFDDTGAVVMLPMIGMAPEAAIHVASDFPEFARGFRHDSASGK
ncbi:SMI1/KNR4 family protein [Hydrogenophaga sp. A37]|uniref:SMI1/KNR4 family protein n=1 Tax=Hydrogenophaga sp. A37 TaxID=1945864 RepID=UPI0009872B76|nr:SMI1/KNR4 family protein [Hydrogenophaga sp. A37]OOG86937.1 hypothetical protein B0E41_05030 [Hydrogenophaga sp. A37]